MTYTWQDKSSILFGTTDLYQKYGIMMTDDGMPQDVLLPQLRSRKVVVPLRNGAYDYGAHYYDERAIQVTCVTTRVLTRDESRELAYTLSKKQQIRFWTEPDKYYFGRVYQPPALEQIRNVGFRFSLTFIVDPFAYGRTVTESFVKVGNDLSYTPNYKGTAVTPTYIVIENTGNSNATNIQVIQTIKREL